MGYAEYNGTLLGKPVLDEMDRLIEWKKVLMRGASKPNSPLFEIKKIDREILRSKDHDEKVRLSTLRDNLIKCCPSSTTVNDALEFKDLIKAINKRLIDITGIKAYYE